MTLSIIDSIEKFMENIKDWFIQNGSNPLLWLGIFVVGLLIFEMVFQSLHRD